jgi:hypothetical protein
LFPVAKGGIHDGYFHSIDCFQVVGNQYSVVGLVFTIYDLRFWIYDLILEHVISF